MEDVSRIKYLEAENQRLLAENGLLRAHNAEIHEHLQNLMQQDEQRDSGAVVRVVINTVEELVPVFFGMGYFEKLELHKAAVNAGNEEVLEFLELQGIGLN